MPPVLIDAFERALPSKALMRTLGATLGQVTLGQVEIALVPKPEVSQQHGFMRERSALSRIVRRAMLLSA
jgi:hypothetical protein